MVRSKEEIVERFAKTDEMTKDVIRVTLGLNINDELSTDRFDELFSKADQKTCQFVESWLFGEQEGAEPMGNQKTDANTNLVDYVKNTRAKAVENMHIYDDIIKIGYKWDPCDLGFMIEADYILDFRDDNLNLSLYPVDSVDSILRKMNVKPTRENIDKVMEMDDWHIHFARKKNSKETLFYYHELLVGYEFEKALFYRGLMLRKIESFLSKVKETFATKGEAIE